MEVPTIFLSRLIGLAALILSAAMLVGKPPLLAAVELISEDRATLFVLGIAGVVAGLAIVLTHNVWTKGLWPLVVTLCGWLILVRGALVLILPTDLLVRVAAAAHYADYFYLYAAIPLVLGVYLSICGFIVRQAAAPDTPRRRR